MWNTGLCQLRNGTTSTLFFIDEEDTFHSAVINPGEIYEGDGVIFPWCINSYEVFKKAFRVYRGTDRTGPLILWMFQNYVDDTVYYIAGNTVLWNQKQGVGEGPSPYLRISIGTDEIPFGLALPYCSFVPPATSGAVGEEQFVPKYMASSD